MPILPSGSQTVVRPATAHLEPANWVVAEFFIAEVKQAEHIPPIAVFKWDAAIDVFRAVETQRLIVGEPTAIDLKIHEAFLHALIRTGQRLQIRIETIEDEELSRFGIQRDNLIAFVNDLQETLTTWNSPVPESFIRAMDDFNQGRFVSIETAHNESPPPNV